MSAAALRTYRSATGVSQRAFAAQLGVPSETYRTWESGRRPAPADRLTQARLLAGLPDPDSLRPLAELAVMARVHVRTLQNAARDGRLRVTYDTRTTFRRLRPRASLADVQRFKAEYFGKQVRPADRKAPLAGVLIPADYDQVIRLCRERRALSQAEFARLLGAAGKAVIYQWESRKRLPSPLFWDRIRSLECETREHPLPRSV